MRAFVILLLSALMLGAAGGYAWWALTASAAHAPVSRKATSIALPPSPEERPEALDEEWEARAQDEDSPAAPAAAASVQDPQTADQTGAAAAAVSSHKATALPANAPAAVDADRP